MIRSTMIAALILALALSAAGCGGNESAGASTSRWSGTRDPAVTYNNEARGPLENGRYDAGEDGRVSGYRSEDARRGRDAGQAARDAGNALTRGARDAARSIGDAAEDILEDAADAGSGNSTGQRAG